MIGAGQDWLYLDKSIDLCHQLGSEVGPLVREYLPGDSYSGEELEKFLGNVLGIDSSEGNGFWIVSCIITDN